MNIETRTGVYTHNGIDNTFEFKTNLNAYDKMQFINDVTNYVVTDENYYSIVKDMFFDFVIISMFTNVDLTEIEDSKNSILAVEELVNDTEIVKVVKANMVDGLLDELYEAVDNNIAYKSGVNNDRFTVSISHFLKTLEKKMDELDMSEAGNMIEKLNSISGELTADKIVDAYAKSNTLKDTFDEYNNDKEKTDKTDKSGK